jgi:hypothetical protein
MRTEFYSSAFWLLILSEKSRSYGSRLLLTVIVLPHCLQGQMKLRILASAIKRRQSHHENFHNVTAIMCGSAKCRPEPPLVVCFGNILVSGRLRACSSMAAMVSIVPPQFQASTRPPHLTFEVDRNDY